ncbi:MAG: DEAD/DEAH box helicase, partial [Erythrobacter sp.]|nr:DEAD/DEAH box helicase [Erythrobacter sp.]
MSQSDAQQDISVSGNGAKVLRIMRALVEQPLLYLTDDETEAENLAAVVSAMWSDAVVVHVPASDALPGEDAPASPSNVGRRVAALRRLRKFADNKEDGPLVLIASGEAAARLYPKPNAFASAPPLIRVGDPIDGEAFREQALSLGYFADDRIDEHGEIAIRGEVIDIYPADAAGPVRIDIDEGRIAAMHHFDAVTQMRGEPCEALEIGRAAEPDEAAEASLLDHLEAGIVLMSSQADKRRKRFVKLAERLAKETDGALDAVSNERWREALDAWKAEEAVEGEDAIEAVPRFAEKKSTMRSVKRFLAKETEAGRRLVLAG